MDIFTLDHVGSTYKDGKIVNGLSKKQWVERYLEPGQFTLVGEPTDQLREQLAIGTLISHVDTKEVMIVEDHQIEEKSGSAPIFTITGRSLDSFAESRVVTDNSLGFNGPTDSGPPKTLYDGTAWPYKFSNVTPPELAVKLLEEQLEYAKATRSAFVVPDLSVSHNITTTYTRKDQDVPRGDLSSQLLEILGDIEAGLKTRRPDTTHYDVQLLVHKGVNRKATVRFSFAKGDVLNAKYLWSSRDFRNAAYISTRYQGLYVSLGGAEADNTGLGRRVTFIDATDIEQADTWDRVAEIYSLLKTRAKRELRKKKRERNVLEAQVSPLTRYRYRKHYDIGDVVHVDGNYNVSANMRVVEYVETDEGSGSLGVPTLEAVRTDDDSDLDIYTWEERGGAFGVT